MFRSLIVAAGLTLAAFATLTPEKDMVGQDIPEARPVDIGGVPAESYDDFIGQTVLIEFFAYW